MKIVIEDVPEDLARELVMLAASCGLGTTREPEWTPARAASLLRDLPEGARQIIRLTVEGNGWADARSVRGSIGGGEGTSLRRQAGSISRAIRRGVRAGRLPEGLPVPLTAQYDPVNPSYQRTTGFVMPEALLSAFRAAISQL
jgi:hypothetical protein